MRCERYPIIRSLQDNSDLECHSRHPVQVLVRVEESGAGVPEIPDFLLDVYNRAVLKSVISFDCPAVPLNSTKKQKL